MGAVPPLCVATSRAKTVLNTGRHIKSAERQRGRGCMIRMCNTIIRMASFVQPPCQGRGPASGGEGTAERMCGVWGDATVACCRAVVRRLCGLCRGVCGRYLCASSPLDAIRAACGLKAKGAPSSKDEARSRPRYGTALCTASIVHSAWHSGLCTARRRDGALPAPAVRVRVHRERTDNLPRIRVAGSGLSACELCTEYDANYKTEHTCAPAHIPRSTKTSRNRTKPPRLVRPCSYMQ